jgi:hypothetical protein
MTNPRFCVFCGKNPESKNKEHVLPKWLLALTGDPARVVNFGVNYKTGKNISFAWQGLVVPSCVSCNTKFANLEGKVRPIIEELLARRSLPARDYDTLLDWLDKVRVGLWLNYHLIQGNPMGVKPSFYVENRIRTKDRLVAVYPIRGQGAGLNAFGVETLAFNLAPSAFGLRINDILLVNCSSDYIFSGRCGLPCPAEKKFYLDGQNQGTVNFSNFRSTRKIKSPLFSFKLYKPSVYLLQPIMQKASTPVQEFPYGFMGDFSLFDSFLAESTIGKYQSGIGKLHQQKRNSVIRIDDMEDFVEFDSAKGKESKRIGYLVSQVYDLQIYLQSLYKPVAEYQDALLRWNDLQNKICKLNRSYAREYRKKSNVHS